MDIMKIESKFMTSMISKVIKRIIKKKLGYQVDIQLNSLNVNIEGDTAHVHLDVDADMKTADLKDLMKGED